MSQDTQIWDLGEIETVERSRSKDRPRAASQPVRRTTAPAPPAGSDWGPGLSVAIPGAAAFLRGAPTEGWFFLTGLGFLGALSWAVYATLDRVAATFLWLGIPEAAAVWVLGGLGALGAVLHLVNVASSGPAAVRPPPPLASALASAAVPGWGQAWNGDLGRAVVFLAGTWVVAGSWVLTSPWVSDLLTQRNLVLPGFLEAALAPAPWSAFAAALWSLAVYDAFSRATWIRA